MNILLFTDADVFAGTEAHIFDLARALRKQGVQVAIACPVPAPLAQKAAAAGIAVLPVAKRSMPDTAAVKILAAELRAGRVDIIHAHNGRTHLLAVAAVKRAGRGKVVATQHFLAPNRTGRRGPKAWLAARLHRWAEKNTDAFIAISHAVRDAMLARGDAPAEKITVVYNGTAEPETFSPQRIAALRQELGVGADSMVFCAARLQKEKDIPTLIKAFAALRFNDQGSMINDQNERGLATEGTEAGDDGGSPRRNAEATTTDFHHEDTKAQRHEDTKDGGDITDGGPASRQVYPAGPTSGAALPNGARCEMPDARCRTAPSSVASVAIPPSSGIPSFPQLFIAGEGDQRPEIETLIHSLFPPTPATEAGDDGGSPRRTRRNAEATTTDFHHKDTKTQRTTTTLEAETGLADQPAGRDCDGDGGSPQRTRRNAEATTTDFHHEDTKAERHDDTKDGGEITDGGPASRQVNGARQNENAALSQNARCEMPDARCREALSSGIRLLGFRSDVSALMAACDIFVLPAPAEPFGLVLIEAMALGKPVIAAGAGGPLEIVADGESGLLVPPHDPAAMAAAISQLLADPEKIRAMGAAGRRRFETHFTANRMARQMADIYHKIVPQIHAG